MACQNRSGNFDPAEPIVSRSRNPRAFLLGSSLAIIAFGHSLLESCKNREFAQEVLMPTDLQVQELTEYDRTGLVNQKSMDSLQGDQELRALLTVSSRHFELRDDQAMGPLRLGAGIISLAVNLRYEQLVN